MASGVTLADPDIAGVPLPTAGEIVTDVAFVVCHVSVADSPLVMVVALDANVAVGVGVCGGGGGVVEAFEPPQEDNTEARNPTSTT